MCRYLLVKVINVSAFRIRYDIRYDEKTRKKMSEEEILSQLSVCKLKHFFMILKCQLILFCPKFYCREL